MPDVCNENGLPLLVEPPVANALELPDVANGLDLDVNALELLPDVANGLDFLVANALDALVLNGLLVPPPDLNGLLPVLLRVNELLPLDLNGLRPPSRLDWPLLNGLSRDWPNLLLRPPNPPVSRRGLRPPPQNGLDLLLSSREPPKPRLTDRQPELSATLGR